MCTLISCHLESVIHLLEDFLVCSVVLVLFNSFQVTNHDVVQDMTTTVHSPNIHQCICVSLCTGLATGHIQNVYRMQQTLPNVFVLQVQRASKVSGRNSCNCCSSRSSGVSPIKLMQLVHYIPISHDLVHFTFWVSKPEQEKVVEGVYIVARDRGHSVWICAMLYIDAHSLLLAVHGPRCVDMENYIIL